MRGRHGFDGSECVVSDDSVRQPTVKWKKNHKRQAYGYGSGSLMSPFPVGRFLNTARTPASAGVSVKRRVHA